MRKVLAGRRAERTAPARTVSRAYRATAALAVTLTILASDAVQAQTPAPTLEWQKITASPLRPRGTNYVWNGSTYDAIPATVAVPQTPAQSGADWWYNLAELKDGNGNAIGYVTVGYSSAENWGYTDGCFQRDISGAPSPNFFETNDHRKSTVRGAIARYALNGDLVWYKSFYGGLLTGVVQDADGNIVACGQAANATFDFFDDIANPQPLLLNPVNGSSTTTLPTSGCTGSANQMIVMKLGLDGHLEWNHLFNPTSDPFQAILRRSGGADLVETDKNGVKGYRIAGDAGWDNGDGTFANGRLKPYFVQLDHNGFKQWDQVVQTATGYWPNTVAPAQDFKVSALAMDRVKDAGTQREHFVVTGMSDQGNQKCRAWVMYFDEPTSATGYVPYTWMKENIVDNAQFPQTSISLGAISTDVRFKLESGTEKVIWPVVGNLHGVWYSGNHYAENGLVYKLASAAPNTVEAVGDVGELHAFDLQLGVCITSDGNIVAVGTKWPWEKTKLHSNSYGHGDLSTDRQNCETTTSNTFNWNPAEAADGTNFYSYWGTQSYAAKLNGVNLTPLWSYQWEHGYQTSDDCYPGNVRHRQCNFKVVEATGGGFVLCGNTGHNFDDAYLARLSDCEARSTFTTTLPLNAQNEYHITGNATWSTSMNVKGTIVVDAGASLTVDGAIIGFADSRQWSYPTRLVVERSATLNVLNNAVLTTLPGCTQSMWDGIQVFGQEDVNSGDPDGAVNLSSGATVSNALTGVLTGDGDALEPGYSGARKGGTILATDAHFLNNRYDVVIHGHPSGQFLETYWTEPYFGRTDFRTTDRLHYTWLDPVAHVRAADHGQIVFDGCAFSNDLPVHYASKPMGYGIDALNANIAVWPDDGQNLPTTFTNLDHGIHSVMSAGTPFTNVVQSHFTDNVCGAYIQDLDGFALKGNTVRMGRWDMIGNYNNPDEVLWQNYHRGIFSTGGYDFTMQDNDLGLSSNADPDVPTEGIVVGYTRDHNDIVFRNTATGLDNGFVGEGISADVDGDPYVKGLQFQCNSTSGNTSGILNRKANGDQLFPDRHTIRGRQGSSVLNAANTFGGQGGTLDYERTTSSVDVVAMDYYYANNPGQTPVNYTSTGVNYVVPTLVDGGAGSACVTPGPGIVGEGGGTVTGLHATLQASKQTYGNTRYLYDHLIDDGNTDEVVQEIVDAWPQEILDLRAYLLSKSPYLSTDALKEFMEKPGVPVAIRGEVLIANPDATKKDGFLKWAVYYAPYPLPEYMAANVEASWDTKTYRTTLEMQMADAHATMTQAAARLVQKYLTGPDANTTANVRAVWQEVRTNGARYAEAALLMGTGDFASAQAVVQAMPQEKELKPGEEDERTRMLTYIGVLSAAAAEGRNAYGLKPAEVDQLQSMVGAHYDRPANWASNLLCAVYHKCRAPYTGGTPGTPKAATRAFDLSAPVTTTDYFGVFPNPAQNWTTFNYAFALPQQSAGTILVRDAAGRVAATLPLAGQQGQQVFDTRALAAGVYLVEYTSGGKVVHTEKLVVQP